MPDKNELNSKRNAACVWSSLSTKGCIEQLPGT